MSIKFETLNKSEIKIKQINGSDTIPVRHVVLRKGKPIEACYIPQDNLESSFHFGLFYKNQLIGVCSFVADNSTYFKEKNQYRLRAMAVLEDFQGLHLGRQLLNHGVNFLKNKNINRLWFNARVIAINFYKNNGFEIIGDVFDIKNVGKHYVMHKIL